MEWLLYHHLTAALYFSIGFIEALLNEKHRESLQSKAVTEEQIVSILRRGSSLDDPKKGRTFEQRFCELPSIIAGKSVEVSADLRQALVQYNEVRGNLTHPKSRGYEIYQSLEQIKPDRLLTATAEYGITIYTALGERFPYWLFGWNYLNPSAGAVDPFLINDQQFLHSLDYLGMSVPAFDAVAADHWKNAHLKTVTGFQKISAFLASCPECEPLDPDFPLRPRLAKKWWESAVLERNAHNTKRRRPPVLFGTAMVSGCVISPIKFHSEPGEV